MLPLITRYSRRRTLLMMKKSLRSSILERWRLLYGCRGGGRTPEKRIFDDALWRESTQWCVWDWFEKLAAILSACSPCAEQFFQLNFRWWIDIATK